MNSKVIILIPTYNEFDSLNECLNNLYTQNISNIDIYIINAGDEIPFDLPLYCKVYSVPSNYFWAQSVEFGFQKIRELIVAPEFVFLINADIVMLSNSIKELLRIGISNENRKIICSSPVYTQAGDRLKLFYSHIELRYFLAYRPNIALWDFIENAPNKEFEASMVGGQAVLIPFNFIKENKIDYKLFPQYGGDTNFWLTARKANYKIMIVPTAAAIEIRPGGSEIHSSRSSFTIKNLLDKYNPYSLILQWNLSRKHFIYPIVILSVTIYFMGRVFNLVKRKFLIQ